MYMSCGILLTPPLSLFVKACACLERGACWRSSSTARLNTLLHSSAVGAATTPRATYMCFILCIRATVAIGLAGVLVLIVLLLAGGLVALLAGQQHTNLQSSVPHTGLLDHPHCSLSIHVAHLHFKIALLPGAHHTLQLICTLC